MFSQHSVPYKGINNVIKIGKVQLKQKYRFQFLYGSYILMEAKKKWFKASVLLTCI